VVEREINSANDNPLIDPESGRLYKAGNFYGADFQDVGHPMEQEVAAVAARIAGEVI